MKLFTPHSSSPTPYSYKGSPPVPVFYCGICLENHALSDGFTFKYCVAEHKFCLDCITSYTAHQISMGVVHHICPLETCRVAATDEELQTLVDEETFNKYLRFKKLKSDPDYRECSKCNSQINHGIRSLENSVIDTYIISCENCGNKSCFLHGDAHSPDESCKQYARRMRRTEKESQQLLNRISKKCPECKVDTEKSGGCNHMVKQMDFTLNHFLTIGLDL